MTRAHRRDKDVKNASIIAGLRVVFEQRVERTVVEAFDRYDGTPCTTLLKNKQVFETLERVRLRQDFENIRWARGHVDDDEAAALLAATALSADSVVDIRGVSDWTFSSVTGDTR